MAAVALFGVGGPVVSIGVPKIVAEWFPPRERGRAAGLYTTAPTIGGIVVLATAAGVLLRLLGSWRLVMLVFAVAAGGALLLWTLYYRDSPAPGGVGARPAPVARVRGRWLVLLRERNMRLLLVLALGTFVVNHGLNAWQPTYLEEAGFHLAAAGRWTAVGTLCGLLTALIVPGFFARRRPAHGRGGAAAGGGSRPGRHDGAARRTAAGGVPGLSRWRERRSCR